MIMTIIIAIGWSRSSPGSDIDKEGEKKNGWVVGVSFNLQSREGGGASEQINELFSHRA